VRKTFSQLGSTYPEAYLQKDLDLFCWGLYDAWVGQELCEYVGGTAAPSPAVEVVKDLAVEDGGTILFGPPERGKSWVLLAIAVSIEHGIPSVFDVQKRRVLFVNLERSGKSVLNRLGRVNAALGLDPTTPLHIMNRRGRTLAEIYGAVKQSVEANDIEFILLDSLTRAGLGDLNENLTGNRAVDMLNGLARGWIAIGHSPRNDDTHVYGTIMQEAGADVMVRCVSQVAPPTLGIGLFRTKGSELAPVSSPQVIALRFDITDGLCGVQRSKLAEYPEILMAAAGDSKAEQVKSYLSQVGKATATEISDELGIERSLVHRLLTSSKDYIRLEKDGKRVYYGLADPGVAPQSTNGREEQAPF